MIIVDKGVFKFYFLLVFFYLRNIDKKKIIIKSPHPYNKTRQSWGDYHLSNDLCAAINRTKRFSSYVVPFEYWDLKLVNFLANATVVVRGVRKCNTNHKNTHFMYLISHSKDVSMSEMEKYKLVFCASKQHSKQLEEAGINSIYLPQFTVPNKFKLPDKKISNLSDKTIFIGNTRGVFREAVKYCVEEKIDVHVFGKGWGEFINKKYIKGTYINNDDLYKYYASSAIILNDHWEDMKNSGFVSNRIYDATACGGFIISDHINSIVEDYKGSVETFNSKKELIEKIKFYTAEKDLRLKMASTAREITLRKHTDAIVSKILVDHISEYLS